MSNVTAHPKQQHRTVSPFLGSLQADTEMMSRAEIVRLRARVRAMRGLTNLPRIFGDNFLHAASPLPFAHLPC